MTTPQILAVSTDVCAFVGFTERADGNGQRLRGVPTDVMSMADYERAFGGAPPAAAGFALYDSVMLFFANGGRRCRVVAVGTYGEPLSSSALIGGLAALTAESSVALVAAPDAALLPLADCVAVHLATLAHCGDTTRNRFAILDVPRGDQPLQPDSPVASLGRALADAPSRSFGAAYYPWLRVALPRLSGQVRAVPAAGAIAGVYASMDIARGVWHAPANVGLADVIAPAAALSAADQESMTFISGVTVNAIRTFPGRGTLVWGARTLDGNSSDWRYVNVRRTVLMIEESIRLALAAFAPEPNTLPTWTAVRAMVTEFLTGLWKSGGLAGTRTVEAFGVRVGLGETMTQQDVTEGRLRLLVLVAVVRPAEFIVLTIDQHMAT